MSQFPVLQTGAVAQYPSQKGVSYAVDIVRFVDGREQKSRAAADKVRRWVIRLDMVDEGELAALDVFFADLAGASGEFPFTDPWDGTVYPSCSLESDDFQSTLYGPARGKTRIVVKENKS